MSQIHSLFAKIQAFFRTFTLTTPVAIVIAALILGASHVAYGMVASTASNQAPAAMFAGKPLDDKDYIEGDASSDVIVVEYSDPECPFCVQLHPTMKQIRNEYEDRVAFAYRYFPLTQIHPHSYDESKAIACAATLGGTKGFYEYIDALFGYKSAQQTTQLPATGKEDIAANIGLDRNAFLACEKDQATAETIDASLNDGIQAGVQGTPTSFVLQKTKKGYAVIATIDGARPYEYIKAAIDQALAN
jgi:protein-disulfide isomerase